MDLAAGTLVDGKYRVVRLLGRGGMGAVYEAENVRIHKTVAMKVLAAGAAEDVVRRFEKEAQAAGRIGSEHIVEVHDLGTMPGGEPYMVMEYLDGETLRARLHRDRTLTVEAALPLLVQLLEGLGAAHAAGIVHRDLKPENVYLLKERGGLRDWVKILDFGISKFASVTEDGMTKTGQVIGTPQYMAPEQIKAPQLVDGRTDLYAVGVIFYQLLTGAIPFKAKTYAELLFKIVYEPLPHPASLVPELDATYAGRAACEILLKAMSRDPEQRYASAGAMRDALLELGARIGAPITGETTGTTRAFMRATGHAMPVAPGVAAFDPRGSGRHDAMTPGGSMPSSPSGGAWPPTSPEVGFGRPPAPTQILAPGVGAPPGAFRFDAAGATPHPGLVPTPFPAPGAMGGGALPTPNPSFGGVPVATHAPPAGDAGRKAAVAAGAAILAVALGVVGFLVTRPTDAPASAGGGAPIAAPAAVDATAVVPAAAPPADVPAPEVRAEPEASAAPVVDASPEPSSSAPAASPPPTARPRATGDATSRPKAPPKPPAPRSTSVLGY